MCTGGSVHHPRDTRQSVKLRLLVQYMMLSEWKFLYYLAFNFFLNQVILSLVVKDDMNFLGAVATDVRA